MIFSLSVGRNAIFSNIDWGGWGIRDLAFGRDCNKRASDWRSAPEENVRSQFRAFAWSFGNACYSGYSTSTFFEYLLFFCWTLAVIERIAELFSLVFLSLFFVMLYLFSLLKWLSSFFLWVWTNSATCVPLLWLSHILMLSVSNYWTGGVDTYLRCWLILSDMSTKCSHW